MADQLLGLQPQPLVRSPVGIVAVVEPDPAALALVQPSVAQGDAVAVAGEVVDHLLGVAQAGLGVDHPVGGGERFEHRLELARVGEAGELPGAPRGAQIDMGQTTIFLVYFLAPDPANSIQ